MLGVGYQNPVGWADIKSRVTVLCNLGPMKKYDEFYWQLVLLRDCFLIAKCPFFQIRRVSWGASGGHLHQHHRRSGRWKVCHVEPSAGSDRGQGVLEAARRGPHARCSHGYQVSPCLLRLLVMGYLQRRSCIGQGLDIRDWICENTRCLWLVPYTCRLN